MAVNFAYNYAEIDNATGMCIGMHTTTNGNAGGPTAGGTTFIPVPVYDEEYLLKYYIDGNWYEDAEGTIPWTSSLI